MWLVVIAVFAVLSGSTVGLVPTASAANTFLTNPLGFAYQDEINVSLYGHPAGMLVTGRCNRYNDAFTNARAAGAEILAYLQPNDRPDIEGCALDTGFYLGRPSDVPLWPFPTPGHRVGFQGTHMTDMRAGSSWILHVVSYVENLMREDKVDGVFLDVIGGRLWNALAGWDPNPNQSDPWTQQEKDEWTKGSIDLVRRLDASRQAINPNFIIVNNNNWSRVEKDGSQDQLGREGEKYVDGICLEHHSINDDFNKREAGHAFGNGRHRRVLVIALNKDEAGQWAGVQGVTHVSDQPVGLHSYAHPTDPPPIPFNRLTDRPKSFGRTDIGAVPSGGMKADQKRGSKFTLAKQATLLGFKAYLDGRGDPNAQPGTAQSVRMVLYRDSNGEPGARVAQSPTANISAGYTGHWVDFTAAPTPLTPGQYWIVIHTGGIEGIARNYGGDGGDNWFGGTNNNIDTFADGPSNPFGPGAAGTGTLSVYTTYTVG